MKVPLVVAVKHGVIISLTVRWNVEFLVPYETVYRNLGTRRKDIKVRFTSRNTFPTSISKNQKKIKPLYDRNYDRHNLSSIRSYNEIAAVCPTSCGRAKVRCISSWRGSDERYSP